MSSSTFGGERHPQGDALAGHGQRLADEADADGELDRAGAQASGGLPADLDVELETVRLRALLDGLGLQAALFPRRFTPDLLRAVLRRHLDSLVTPDRDPG